MYRMVIVDDEEFILEQMLETFAWDDMGFTVSAVFSGAAKALAYLKEHRIDVLFTDIRLGRESGLDLAREIRGVDEDIEIVFLSAYNEFEYAHTAIQLGAFDYIVKPVTYQSVTDCFQRVKAHLAEKKGMEAATLSPAADKAQNYQIELAKAFIGAHYGQDIGLDDVAEHVAMNSSYFSRFFKRHTGEQFIAYLSRVRIEKAIELLANPAYKSYEVCQMVGYHSKRHFYALFKKYMGKTPIEYRNEVLRISDVEK